MFTITDIKEAHSHVQTGADFPAYIAALKAMGVRRYENSVTDGSTLYEGDAHQERAQAVYTPLTISRQSNREQFLQDLRAHQQGDSDYFTFCRQCAEMGVEKWIVVIDAMTCTYYDRSGAVLLEERIPA